MMNFWLCMRFEFWLIHDLNYEEIQQTVITVVKANTIVRKTIVKIMELSDLSHDHIWLKIEVCGNPVVICWYCLHNSALNFLNWVKPFLAVFLVKLYLKCYFCSFNHWSCHSFPFNFLISFSLSGSVFGA